VSGSDHVWINDWIRHGDQDDDQHGDQRDDQHGVVSWPPGWGVWYVAETGSTNADLLAASLQGAPDRTVLRTAHQTAGRGRLDRRWDAPPESSLLVSILFREPPGNPNALIQRVALAAVDAVSMVADLEARLKWPNDVELDGRKLAGVLAQRGSDGSVIVGLGLNVKWAPEGAAKVGENVEPVAVLAALLRSFDTLPADTHDRYRRALVTLGQRVRVELPAGQLSGRAIEVERDGRLVVLDECAVSHYIDAGDIVHLRPG
jgi:BirA family transcriptional regulator, biotin operon repressor / biotin---[acetyl-CoA-carboxylase] ligase